MKSITLKKTNELCSKCGGNMVIKGHQKDDPKLIKQKQYFTQWNYCLCCKTQWFDPKYLVINNNRKTEIQEYYEERNNLFKNL